MEFERRFINTFETYRAYIIGIINAFEITKNGNKIDIDTFVESPAEYMERINKWGNFNLLKIYNAHYRAYSEIAGRNPSLDYKREGIVTKTEQIEKSINTILSTLPKIIGHMVQDLHPELNLQFQDLDQNRLLLGGPQNEIQQNLLDANPPVLSNEMLSHQMLLINNKENKRNSINSNDNIRVNDISVYFIDSIKSIKLSNPYVVITDNPDDFAKSILELIEHTMVFFKK